jgi:Spy/CpxP family protein refolding chaperone
MTSMRLWAGLFALVVFIAGVAGGVALRPWIPWSSEAPGPEFGPPGPRGGRPGGPPTGRLLDRIAGEIDLTPEQDARLREVFDTRGLRMREINEQVRGLFETEQAQMNDEIAAILTPEQMEVFSNQIVRMRGARGRRGGRGGPRGPGFRRAPQEDAPR